MSGFSKTIARQHIFNCRNSLLLGLRHNYPFAGRQAVSFHHDRRAFSFNVINGGGLVGKAHVFGGWNAVPGHEIFAKSFGAFKLCCTGARPKAGQSGGGKDINNAFN